MTLCRCLMAPSRTGWAGGPPPVMLGDACAHSSLGVTARSHHRHGPCCLVSMGRVAEAPFAQDSHGDFHLLRRRSIDHQHSAEDLASPESSRVRLITPSLTDHLSTFTTKVPPPSTLSHCDHPCLHYSKAMLTFPAPARFSAPTLSSLLAVRDVF